MDSEKQGYLNLLSSVITVIGDPVFVKDDQCRFVFVNEALLKILGKTNEDLIGKTGGEFLPEEEMIHFLEIDHKVLDSGEENLCEEKLTVSGGEVRTIVTRKTRYVDPNGGKFVVGVIRDITERKQIERELQSKLHELEAMNQFMINREMRIIDLKTQISKLEKGQKKKP